MMLMDGEMQTLHEKCFDVKDTMLLFLTRKTEWPFIQGNAKCSFFLLCNLILTAFKILS